jgi:MFS transporter, ACS family, tartrate transporter
MPSIARKVHWRVLPLLMAAWFVAYIDRFNVSFAALQMNSELGFSSAVFGFGAGIFFLGYCLFEVPSNMMLVRIGPRRWLARIIMSWGAISVALILTHSSTTFFIGRFLLGAAEAGCFPGMAFYLAQWLSPKERAAALGTLGSVAMISGIAGAPAAALLLSLKGVLGLSGWQWLFAVEGHKPKDEMIVCLAGGRP